MYMHAPAEGSKVSRYDSYKQVEKSTGKEPRELKSRPPFSAALHRAWDIYGDIGDCSYQELAAYSRLTGDELEWWEVKAIMRLSLYRGVTPTWPLKQQP